jgi:hypothetical protein
MRQRIRSLLVGSLASTLLTLGVAACGSATHNGIDAGTNTGGDGGTNPGGDAGPACFPVPPDQDMDTIADSDEGKSANTDTDGDGTPDYMDTDTDNDTIPDSVEAGDTNTCTPPVDSDADGIPDFRDTDSDNNGILDQNEIDEDLDGDGHKDFADLDDDGDGIPDTTEMGSDPTHPVDTDGDGIPDYHDLDSDGDGIPDKVEGSLDVDMDGVGNWRDLDSDGDCIPDALEAGSDPMHPRDTDGDGIPDYLDIDSDNDGLTDGQEDANCNGMLDPGESSPYNSDTDGDGFPDIVEVAAGTNPDDPSSVLSPDDFYFVLPQFAPEQTAPLNFNTDIVKADVFFEVDNTGSMGGEISTIQSSLQTVLIPGIQLQVANSEFGAAYFRDFPVSPFGGADGTPDVWDIPFKLEARISNNTMDVQAGINLFTAAGGDDGPEGGLECIYQACTGEGISWTVDHADSIPKFHPEIGFDATKGHGVLGGAGFRVGALPILIHFTDFVWHEAKDYWAAGITQAHSLMQVTAAAQALGARFIGVSADPGAAKTEQKQLSRDTQAVVPPIAWGPTETLCHTGLSGSPESPDPTGLCPLDYEMDFSGTGITDAVVQGVKALVTYGTIDVSAIPISDPAALPAVDTSQFITAITPLPPAPPGSMIVGDVFQGVRPGLPVTFTVHARNTIVPSKKEFQLFRITIRVMGDGVTDLDDRDVFVIIPGGGLG